MTKANSTDMPAAMPVIARLGEAFNGLTAALGNTSLVSLVARLGLAVPFWRSGANKWDVFASLDLDPNPFATTLADSGFFALSPITTLLFENEFKLHLFGATFDYPFPALMGLMSGIGEVVFSVLLVLGLFTRFSALALLGMTVVIQLTVPTGWPTHLMWAAMALAILHVGPGKAALDHVLKG